MKLTILGSGNFIPVKNRSNPAYLLDIKGDTILLDCGSGTTRQLAKAKRSPWEINHLFISHLHIDHVNDIVPLLFIHSAGLPDRDVRNSRLNIYGHYDIYHYMQKLREIYGQYIQSDKFPYQQQEIRPAEYMFSNFMVEVLAAAHRPESQMYRFTNPDTQISILYTGDTDYCQNLEDAAKKSDYVLIECSATNESPVMGHMTPEKIENLIEQTGIKNIIVTHISPEVEKTSQLIQLKAKYPKTKIHIASDLRIYDLDP